TILRHSCYSLLSYYTVILLSLISANPASIKIYTLSLHDALPIYMLLFPIRSKIIDCTRRGFASPWTLIANIRPDPALLHPLAQPFVSQRAIQHPDRGI